MIVRQKNEQSDCSTGITAGLGEYEQCQDLQCELRQHGLLFFGWLLA
jgi:hypothetical protein